MPAAAVDQSLHRLGIISGDVPAFRIVSCAAELHGQQAKCLGVLGHAIGIYDELSAIENLRLFAALYGVENANAISMHWLEKVGLEREIRSGVVLVGGGAEMDGMVEMVEQIFNQSARKGTPRGFGGLSDTVNGPEWAAAAGLLLWGFRDRTRTRKRPAKGLAKVAQSFRSWFATS